jgi:seryl-tRNA synthetase
METKKFSKWELTVIKNTAKNVSPIVAKKVKIREKLEELAKEYNNLQELQNRFEENVKSITGGFTTEDLVERVVETTNSVDKNGNPIKVTKYAFKYPETIIPTTPAPTTPIGESGVAQQYPSAPVEDEANIENEAFTEQTEYVEDESEQLPDDEAADTGIDASEFNL